MKAIFIFFFHLLKLTMMRVILIFFFQILLISCKTESAESGVNPAEVSNVAFPEPGDYISFDANIAPDNFKYDIRTNQWEWKNDIKLQLTPSAFGRLRFNKNGSYEFLDIYKSGTYRQDPNSKILVFTGFMADSEGYYKIKRGWCNLVIKATDKNGKVLSIVYEKKSDFPQPDLVAPNSNFKGTIINMLSNSSTEYIDIATGKIIKTHDNKAFPITGLSKYSVNIYKKNFLDSDEKYPVVEIKDMEGTIVKKFDKTWRDLDKWDIGEYWYGMLSPDGTKLALVGSYMRHSVFLDPKYVTPYPMISVIDVNSGNEIYSYALDNNGNNWGPGWSPNGELVMPRKGGGINILNTNLTSIKTIYTKNVSEARMNQFGQVLFKEGVGIFTMDANGANIQHVKNGNSNLSFTKSFDLGWSLDGKSMAFVIEEYLKTYNIVLVNPESNEVSYFNDAKGDTYQFKSPFLNWK
jgi:hypothetical protein